MNFLKKNKNGLKKDRHLSYYMKMVHQPKNLQLKVTRHQTWKSN